MDPSAPRPDDRHAPDVSPELVPIEAELVAPDPPKSSWLDMFARPNIWGALVWFFALFMVHIGLGVVVAVFYLPFGKMPDMPVLIAVATGGTLVFALGVTSIFLRGSAVTALAIVPGRPYHWLVALLLLAPCLVVTSEISNVAAEFLPGMDAIAEMTHQLAESSWLSIVVFGCLFPAVGEELLFRGFIGRGLVSRYGATVGVLVTSLLFGLMHFYPVHVISAAAIGVILHVVYLLTRTLWIPIALHALNNFVSFWSVRGPFPEIPGFTAGPDGEVSHIWPVLTVAAVFAMLVMLLHLYQVRRRWKYSDGTQWSPEYIGAEVPASNDDVVSNDRSVLNLTLLAAVVGYVAFAAAWWHGLS